MTTQSQLPYEIQSIISQCGGMGLHGAFVYVGAHNFVYNVTKEMKDSKFEDGFLTFGCGLIFKVNGGNRGWKMAITLENSDTYTVYLYSTRNNIQKIIDSTNDVYCDNLQEVVESMYDEAGKKAGFIL